MIDYDGDAISDREWGEADREYLEDDIDDDCMCEFAPGSEECIFCKHYDECEEGFISRCEQV